MSASAPGTRHSAQLAYTAAAAVATLLATLSLSPIFVGNRWLVECFLAIAAVAVIGSAARYARLPRTVVALLQLGGLIALITARFAPQNAVLGIVPTRTTLADLVDLAEGGARSINEQAIPVLDVRGIVLLVVVGIGVAALEVDVTAVALRSPAVSGIALLAVYGVPATVLREGAHWGWFVLAAAGWLLLLYVGRRGAVREWGQPLHAPRDTFGRDRPDDPRSVLAQRIAIGSVAAGVVVAALAPGIGEGVVNAFGTAGGGGSGGSTTRLDISATLERDLVNRSNIPLLRYSTQDRSPQYLRLAVLDRFDGLAWQPSTPVGGIPILSAPLQVRGLASPVKADQSTRVEAFDKARDLGYLPAPYTAVELDGPGGDWRWDTSTSTVYSPSDRLDGRTYTVFSQTRNPTAASLAGPPSTSIVAAENRVVPGPLPAVVKADALEVTRGASTDYAKAVALQAWFRNSFRYDLEAPPADDAPAIVSFLDQKSGYCQQFAATFALMARTLGIPARVVVGFTPGTATDSGSYTVTTRDFHAWPEVWFDSAGWVRFEPTPRVGAGSNVAVPAWSLPGPLAQPPAPTSSASAQPAPSASSSARPTRKPVDGGTVVTTAQPWTQTHRPLLGTGLLALLALVAVAPGAERWQRRRRRLSRPRGRHGAEAAWDELADTARDLGLPWSPADTPRRTADELVRSAALEGSAAARVQELRRDVEHARYTQDRQVMGEPAVLVRDVRTVLIDGSTPVARWRARLLPRSVLRRRRGRQ